MAAKRFLFISSWFVKNSVVSMKIKYQIFFNTNPQYMEAAKECTNHKVELDNLVLKKGALVFRAINHKLRQQFLKYLSEMGETTVTDIHLKFG